MKKVICGLVFVCFIAVSTVRAGTTWDGQGADASWGNATNWNGDTLPAFNGLDQLSFGTAFGSGLTLTLDGNRSISNLTQTTASTVVFNPGTPADSVLTLEGGSLSSISGFQTHNEDIILKRNGTFNHSGAGSAYLTINGDVSDEGNGYSLTKTGSRYLALNGSNTIGGGVILALGMVQIGHNQALGDGPLRITAASIFRANGNRTITNNIEFETSAQVVFGGAGGNHLTVNAPGQAILEANSSLSLTQADTYYLTFNNGIRETGTNRSLTVVGTRDFSVNGESTFTGPFIMGTVGGSSCRVHAGGTMATTNIIIYAGKVRLNANNPLGTGKISILGAGDCVFDNPVRRDLDNDIDMKGRVTGVQNGSFCVDFNKNSGSCTMIGNVTIELDNLPETSSAPRFWRGIGEQGGSWGLTMDGGSSRYLLLSGTSTYSGVTAVKGGILLLLNPNALPTNTIVSMVQVSTASGVLDLNGNNTQIGNLYGAGYVTTGGGTLTLGGNTTNTFNGFITETGGLIRDGNGTQVLTAASNLTYSGKTSIKSGALRVNGRLSTSSALVEVSGGTLEGTGIVGRAVNVLAGGRIHGAKGLESPGLLTIGSTLRLSNDAVVVWSAAADTQSVIAVNNLLQDSAVTVKVVNQAQFIQPSQAFPLIRYTGTLTGFEPSLWLVDVSESPTLTALRNARVFVEDNTVFLTGLQSPVSPGSILIIR